MKLTTWTKRMIVISITLIIITSMYTGYFSDLLNFLAEVFK